MRPLRSRTCSCLVLLAMSAVMGGCGGGSSSAKVNTPTASTAAPPPAPSNPVGQQVGAQVPQTGPQPAVEGPKMNDAAASSYARGLSAFANGDLAAAKAAFQQAASADPRAYQAHYSLGVVMERLGDPQALTEYRQALNILPSYEPAIVANALLLANKGNLTEAESFLSSKRSQLPNSAATIAALAEVKSIGKDTASAQQLAQEALKKNSDYRPAMVTLARDHYRNRRLDLALYALQAILDGFGEDNPPRDKDNADAHFLRALIYKEEGKRAPAIAEFKRAVELRPDLVGARLELASYYLEAGNAIDAQPLLEGALRFDANNVIAHLDLGDCYRLAGRIPEAKAQFDWVLAHDTTLAQVHYDLGLLYLFSPNLAGFDTKRQTDAAISEISKYQQMRGKLAAGQSDDSDELLNRAKQKLADMQAQAAAAAATEPAPAPAGSAAPAGAAAAPAGKK